MRCLFAIYCKYSVRKTGDWGNGYILIVVESDKPPETARPASDDLRFDRSNDFGTDCRADPNKKQREINSGGAFKPVRYVRPFDHEVCNQHKISWVYPCGLTSLNPAISAALREAMFDLRICA